jgi:hypothetical protein
MTSNRREQVRKERLEQVSRPFSVLQLGGAEAEYLVAGELQVSVATHAVRIPGGVWPFPVRAGVVVGAVDLKDDPLAVGQ